MSAAQQIRRSPAHPITILRDAVLWCRASKIPVRLGDHFGVIRMPPRSGARRWERDPDFAGVNPIGAAILHAQPDATIQSVAAAEALHAPIVWVFGVQDALNQADAERRSPEPEQRALYAAGLEAGTRYREEFLRAGFASVRS